MGGDDDMIIDISDRIAKVCSSYGLSKEEGEYLLEVLILRMYDYSGDLWSIDFGNGIKSGIAFVDFVDKVRRGNYDRESHLRNFRNGVNLEYRYIPYGIKYSRKVKKKLHLRSFVFYMRRVRGFSGLKKNNIAKYSVSKKKR